MAGGIAEIGRSQIEVTSAEAPSRVQQQQDLGAAGNPKFGELLDKIQAKYGAKGEKPREIKKALGKDDFLKIMITQMQHQDPTNPFKADQMANQMAQFSSVEQLQNINQGINKMSAQNAPFERLAMTSLIGKAIIVDKDRFPHKEGDSEALSFNLPKDAANVQVALISETGETVLQKDIGPQKAGEGAFSWDGLKGNHMPAKGGNYILRIDAKDENGAIIPTESKVKTRVVGVSFEGAEPVLLVGDAHRQEKVTLRNVVRIENDMPVGSAPAAPPANAAQPQAAFQPVSPASGGGSNFFTFRKGEGSNNIDMNQANAEVRAAIAGYQAAQQQQQPAAENAQEKGFPNGLTNQSED